MNKVEYLNDNNHVFADDTSAWVLRIGKGNISGYFCIGPSQDPDYRFESIYANSCNFIFRSKDGRCFQYSALVHPLFFWTESTRKPIEKMAEFKTDYEFKCYMDQREDYVITFDTGRKVRGFLKYTPAEFALMVCSGEVRIRAKIWVVDPGNNQEEPRTEIFFATIPIERFLWVRGGQMRGVLAVCVTPLANEDQTLTICPIDVTLMGK